MSIFLRGGSFWPSSSVILSERALASGSPQISASATLSVNANKLVSQMLSGTYQGYLKKGWCILNQMEMVLKTTNKKWWQHFTFEWFVISRQSKCMLLKAFTELSCPICQPWQEWKWFLLLLFNFLAKQPASMLVERTTETSKSFYIIIATLPFPLDSLLKIIRDNYYFWSEWSRTISSTPVLTRDILFLNLKCSLLRLHFVFISNVFIIIVLILTC